MTSLFMFIGTTELLLIGSLALLLFGGKKLPEMMRGLGQGITQFKKGMQDPIEECKDEVDDIKEDTKSVKAEVEGGVKKETGDAPTESAI